jgi:hypothetical protein
MKRGSCPRIDANLREKRIKAVCCFGFGRSNIQPCFCIGEVNLLDLIPNLLLSACISFFVISTIGRDLS